MTTLTLDQALKQRSAPGELYKSLPGGAVHCYACAHNCIIKDGKDGICKVRFNRGGTLYVPRGYVGGVQLDPVEKKPFFHALPGSRALSFGMLGCDYHCAYCQNWLTSQALRDPEAASRPEDMKAEDLVRAALENGAKILTSTYNEPLITSEWAMEVFELAKPRGLVGSYVSNGNATEKVLDYLRPCVDLYKVDLKGFDEKRYRRLGGELSNVLKSIAMILQKGFWLEVVTLVIPGFNDSDEELRAIARFLSSQSRDIPWHVTAFHPDYRMDDRDSTPASTLLRASEIGRAEGLRYVYPGNLPGQVGEEENTRCPSCAKTLIRRFGFQVLEDLLSPSGGLCPCGTRIPGYWKS